MPYISRPPRLRSAIAACAAVLALGAVPAQALAEGSTSSTAKNCEAPVLSQPLLSAGDTNSYFLVPGESEDNFAGTGWSLSAGASIKTVTLADGKTGAVLDLSSGARAVSPTICVTNDDPSARFIERRLGGNQGVNFYVSYWGSKGWSARYGGQVRAPGTAWSLSEPVAMQPANNSGWQLAQITLAAGGNSSEFQLYDLYVDPYVRR